MKKISKKMGQAVEYIKNGEFSKREIVLCGAVLFLLGLVMGILLSPKGDKCIASNNGSNNQGCNAGEDACEGK